MRAFPDWSLLSDQRLYSDDSMDESCLVGASSLYRDTFPSGWRKSDTWESGREKALTAWELATVRELILNGVSSDRRNVLSHPQTHANRGATCCQVFDKLKRIHPLLLLILHVWYVQVLDKMQTLQVNMYM